MKIYHEKALTNLQLITLHYLFQSIQSLMLHCYSSLLSFSVFCEKTPISFPEKTMSVSSNGFIIMEKTLIFGKKFLFVGSELLGKVK